MDEYGPWGEDGEHLSICGEHNRIWFEFINSDPSKEAILAKGYELFVQYVFEAFY